MELVRLYSNPDIRDIVAHTADALAAIKAVAGTKADTTHVVPTPPAPRRWRLVDRLGEHVILELVRSSHTGTTHRALAERYGISLSSVKRVLLRHNSR